MVQRPCLLFGAFLVKGAVALRLHQIHNCQLAGLTTNVELLMLALDVLVKAEQLVSLTGTTTSNNVQPVTKRWLISLIEASERDGGERSG